MTPSELGKRGEAIAAEYLEAKGYRTLDQNYRFEREEVDLVMFEPTPANDGGEIVFVEVKARRGTGFGRPEDAVDEAKQKAIRRVAEAWLHGLRVRLPPRGQMQRLLKPRRRALQAHSQKPLASSQRLL